MSSSRNLTTLGDRSVVEFFWSLLPLSVAFCSAL